MSSTETGDRLLFRLFLVGTAKRVTSETGHTKASADPTGDQIHASSLSPQRLTYDLRDACGRAVSHPAVSKSQVPGLKSVREFETRNFLICVRSENSKLETEFSVRGAARPHKARGEAQRNPGIAKTKISRARGAGDRGCDKDSQMIPLSAASRTPKYFSTDCSWGFASLHPRLYAAGRSAGSGGSSRRQLTLVQSAA
jgi:hypothetical protein